MAYPIKLLSKGLLMGIAFFVIAGFTYLKMQNFLEGPRIEIFSPENGSTITNSFFNITGQARNISFLYLNDGQIFVDEEGNFSESLLAYPGYNIITLRARDKFEREITESLEIVFDAPNNGVLLLEDSVVGATSTPEESGL